MAIFSRLALLLVALVAAAHAQQQSVRLAVSYCPGVFSGLGAVVEVNPGTGAFSVVNKGWSWPHSGGVGCPENEDPTVLAVGDDVWLDFGDNWGLLVDVNVVTGNVSRAIVATTSELEFDGFTAFVPAGADTFLGMTPQASESGFCSDGCFQFGSQDLKTGVFTGLQLVPVKSIMTDVALLDPTTNTFYVQGSYPLTPAAACSADQTQECLYAIDADTGALKSVVGPNAFTVYAWASSLLNDGQALAWVYGFESECDNSGSNYAFATVDLSSGKATLIACIPKGTVVNTDPNVGAFSEDLSMFATSSGNSETGEVQVLVFEVKSGAVLVNSSLPGIKKALGVSTQAPFVNVWGVSWA